MTETKKPIVQQFIIVDGAPASGKTTFGDKLAETMTSKGLPTLAIDQDLFEEVRERPGRLIVAAIRQMAENGQIGVHELWEQTTKAILPDGRHALYETFAVTAVKTLRQGFNVILMANLRPNDRPFFDLAYAVLESYSKKPVELIGVHLKSDPVENLKRVIAREPVNSDFKFTFGRTKEQFQQECAAWSEHGPGYGPVSPNPEYRNYETVVLDPFRPAEKTPAQLIEEYFLSKPAGFIVQPSEKPGKTIVGACLSRVLAGFNSPHP